MHDSSLQSYVKHFSKIFIKSLFSLRDQRKIEIYKFNDRSRINIKRTNESSLC